ncbi:BsuPI-related putative proteinase inhibitor [Cohnella cholangitidis]|uniref:Intracellular proteinase inhibitor BsuPI domain-containing protein n=1 Tax=Cohnella cholangitidis TaxID=2598458 RepID=A0A7G5C1M0_9BACL|nr:BsuPI-related putative proteinase inhibitor [Cohnella cholangitidis]QMV43104.1 hypothetical protein FPL14_19380 [Cohnella cholangitidis]
MGNYRGNCAVFCSGLILSLVLIAGCSNGSRVAGGGSDTPVPVNSGNQPPALQLEAKISDGGENKEPIRHKEQAILDPTLRKQLKEEKDKRNRPVKGLLNTVMDTAMEDGELLLTFSLRNVSERDLTIEFGSGQQYDFAVYNARKEEVYRWSDSYSFTMALVEKEIKKGDRLDYAENWDLKDREGNPVPDGVYTIKVSIVAQVVNTEGRVNADDFLAESTIDLVTPR